MSLADDHKNLAVLPDGTSAVNPSEPRQVRARLQELLAELGGAAGRRGGTIYVPRVRDGQLWVDVTEALRIPREITLSLAPGVVLVPVFLRGAGRGDESHLEIEGVFTAPLATTFATPGWFRRNGRAGAARYEVGAVRLTSPHLERVHPEWWGAAALDDLARPDDSEALAAAVRAGLLDRVNRRAPSRPPLRALALELQGTYALGEPSGSRGRRRASSGGWSCAAPPARTSSPPSAARSWPSSAPRWSRWRGSRRSPSSTSASTAANARRAASRFAARTPTPPRGHTCSDAAASVTPTVRWFRTARLNPPAR